VVDHLDVEDYLRGMGEVLDPNWPGASLQAQAVASRTYALRAMQSGGELCDDDHCQVYLGQQVEHPAMDRAVAATPGLVLMYAHQLADTVFSSNGGSMSATPVEGFGPDAPASIPYLRAGPYLTRDPLPWTVTIGLGDLANRFSYPGTLSGARVGAAGPSGRALEIILDGNRGLLTVDAHRFAAGLGLRSTLITMTVSEADAAPPPPAPADLIQVPPDLAGRMVAAAALDADPGRPMVLPGAKMTGATAVASRHRPGMLAASAVAAALLGAVVASMVLAGPDWRHE
jgi:SpoIID/LytB domain protein